MSPMKFVKAAGENIKLECKCGRQFWYQAAKKWNKEPAVCPDCKEKWDGIHITEFPTPKYFAAFGKVDGRDYQVLMAKDSASLHDFLLAFFKVAGGLIHSDRVTAVKFEGIEEEQYKKLRDAITHENREYMADIFVMCLFGKIFK